jgi:P27 family predicted phage terminase small subunit
VLTLYVETWAANRQAASHVVKHGSVIRLSNGVVCASPFYKVMKETGIQLRGLLNDLGMTPASRTTDESTEPEALEF